MKAMKLKKCPVCRTEPFFILQYETANKQWWLELQCEFHGLFSGNYTSQKISSMIATEEERKKVVERWLEWCVDFDSAKTTPGEFYKKLRLKRGF